MRILIAIGCNAYDYVGSLTGAESDAQRMFDTLIRPELGDYDPFRSTLLLSPSIDEVRQALRQVLLWTNQIDTFSFFFAGHGGVRKGSFYMLVRDSKSEALSFSAFPLADLFRAINEAAPAQSNIIIDACESGGLISDLGVLLKFSVLGDAGTPGITLVATSAQDQKSGETAAGGFGTNAILDCLEGREFVQDSASALDLIEIGRHISMHLRAATDQSPVVWGLNLYGPPRFCRNPRYGSDPTRPLRGVLQAWPSTSDIFIREHYDALWQAYTSASGAWDSRDFVQIVEAVLARLATTPEALAGFIERLGNAVLERAQLAEDSFRPAQVGATLLVSLLPYLGYEVVARQARMLQISIGAALISAGSELAEHLHRDRYALLAPCGSGLSELFYLPLRVANVLGWIGAAPLMFKPDSPHCAEAEAVFARILRLVLEHYTGSITVMSDAQAPCWAVALSRAAALGLNDEANCLAGLLYNSLINCKGKIARIDIPQDKAIEYLMARRSGNFAQALNLVERPDETTTVLLTAAAMLELDDVFDQDIWELDGHTFAAYLNADFAQFGAEVMSGGENLVWTVGREVFRVGDLIASWPPNSPEPTENIAAAAVLSSLLYPDRTPWFLLKRKVKKGNN
jgi:hypothetical protein